MDFTRKHENRRGIRAQGTCASLTRVTVKAVHRVAGFDLLGIRFAINIFIGTTLLWMLIRSFELDPIWAISSMIAASEPKLPEALKFFRGRLLNAVVGCITGLVILFVGGTSLWKIPLALSISVLISAYIVRVPVMWRQAPITATLVVAGGLMDASKMHGVQQGLTRVGDVLLGCLVGLLVTFSMSKVWPLPAAGDER